MKPALKLPESILLVVHTADARVLLLERADQPGFWQSVTGSREPGDADLRACCARELAEETGIAVCDGLLADWHRVNRYPIYPAWRRRYAPDVTHNTEHVFGFMLPKEIAVRLAPDEHLRAQWLGWHEASERCFSSTNVAAIRDMARRLHADGARG